MTKIFNCYFYKAFYTGKVATNQATLPEINLSVLRLSNAYFSGKLQTGFHSDLNHFMVSHADYRVQAAAHGRLFCPGWEGEVVRLFP
jgi:hypothetical protein